MRKSLLVFLLAALSCNASPAEAQDRRVASFDIDEFLARYKDGLRPLDQLYGELANESLPMRDEGGQSLARRHIEDRRQALSDLRATVQQLATSPQDLVLATKLFVQSEALTDDLFDLSQVAYDNNREELGRGFLDLLKIMDHHNGLIESYVVGLAAQKEARLLELEKENQELRAKLRQVPEPARTKATPQP
jgi:hypothetical protein